MSSTNPDPSAETPASDHAAAPAELLTEPVDASEAVADGAAQPAPADVALAADGAAHADAPGEAHADAHADAQGEAQGEAPCEAVAPAALQPVPSPAATGTRLKELFPALFAGGPKPLKLRIQVDIQERAPGEFSKQALSAFFRRHTGATSYLVAVSRGKQRFDLDGQPAGELSEEHRQLATEELARRKANQQARRAQEDAQREQEEAGRRQRANLLRDFHVNRLTTANFCALKGIVPEQLEGLLAQARAEAEQDAARPRRPEHGFRDGGHDQRHDGRNDRRPDGRSDGRHDGRHGAPRRDGQADGRGPGPGPGPQRNPGRRDDRGRSQGPRGPQGPGARPGSGSGNGGGPDGQGGPGQGGRNERRGPPRG